MKSGVIASLVMLVELQGACGEVKDSNKLPDAPPVPDGDLGDATIDAPIDAPAPRCDPAKPFAAATPVMELNSAMTDATPFLSQDELSILFTSNRAGGVGSMDAYIATRTSRTDPFGTPILLPTINTAELDSRPTAPMDRLRVYVETNVTGQNFEIAMASRATTGVPFGAWSVIPQLNSTVTDVAPFILPDDSAIYFISTRGAGGNRELWRSAHPGGNWTTPALVPGTSLNDATIDYPFLTPDELVLYFSSSRAGGAGGRDLWMATRTSTAVPFDAPVNIAALNSTQSESGGWISADNCVIYFSRDIGVAAANPQIFRAEKPL